MMLDGALGAVAAIVLFVACCVIVSFIGWAIVKIYTLRTHRKAVADRLDQIPYGDCPSVTEMLRAHRRTEI